MMLPILALQPAFLLILFNNALDKSHRLHKKSSTLHLFFSIQLTHTDLGGSFYIAPGLAHHREMTMRQLGGISFMVHLIFAELSQVQ